MQIAQHRLSTAHDASVKCMQGTGCSWAHIAGPAAKPASDIHRQLAGHVAPVLQAAVELTGVHKPASAASESYAHRCRE